MFDRKRKHPFAPAPGKPVEPESGAVTGAYSDEELTNTPVLDFLALNMDVARFNFSHGTQEEQLGRLEKLKKLRRELDMPVAALMDTKGPEIRLGTFENGGTVLKTGDSFVLTTEECQGTPKRVSVSYEGLPSDVKHGDRILLDDGKISLLVKSVKAGDITCTVENDGPISDRKGVNVPGVSLSMSPAADAETSTVPAALPLIEPGDAAELEKLAALIEKLPFVSVLPVDGSLDALELCDGSRVYLLRWARLGEGYNAFLKMLFSQHIKKLSHNVKDFLGLILSEFPDCGGFVFDTALAAYLLDPTESGYELPRISAKYLGDEKRGAEAVFALYPALTERLRAENMAAQREKAETVHELLPVYLRLSQAERERQERVFGR